MNDLRQRMIDELTIRNYSPLTRALYVQHFDLFTRHVGKSPEGCVVVFVLFILALASNSLSGAGGLRIRSWGSRVRSDETTMTKAYTSRDEVRMQRASKRTFALAVSFATAAAAIHGSPQAAAQTGPGWVSLFDGKTIGSEWERFGETNWRVEDGAIVADKRTSQTEAHLVTTTKFKDFQLYVEFWASDDANSGIFLRCSDPKTISSRTCYEANIYDQRPDPTYGTGAIVDFVEVHPMPKAGSKWNTYEITVKGRRITAVLNGEKTAELHNGLFTEGPLTLQHGAGVIKFRKVRVKPL